jgi:hypothetical protein
MRGQLARSCRGARTIPFPRFPSTQSSKERLHGVRRDALGADRIGGMVEPNEEALLYKRTRHRRKLGGLRAWFYAHSITL